MKLSSLFPLCASGCLLVPSLTHATTSSLQAKNDHAPQVYGRARLSFNTVDLGEQSTTEDTRRQFIATHGSRLGVKGKQRVDEQWQGLYKIEFGVKASGDEDSEFWSLRNTYVGLKHRDIGRFRIGKIDTAYKSMTGKLDIFSGTVADYNQVIGAASGEKASKLFNVRAKQIVVYDRALIKDLSISASYSQNQLATEDVEVGERDNVSFALRHNKGAFTFVTGYERQRFADAALSGKKVALQYRLQKCKFSWMYETISDSRLASSYSRDAFLFNAQWQHDHFTYQAQLWRAKESDAGNDGAKGASIGVIYRFSKQLSTSLIYSAINNDTHGRYGFNAGVSPTVTPAKSNILSDGTEQGADLAIVSLGLNYHFGY
ncbi:porin [Pseudoalteromonas luteoviolacea]|uniref:porin n=1 Tax=Pseudoalteromonas luteoviolacea TaxID=43657 RepID=UPI001B37EB4E|nr:porin [Pseudoalteromonas luteoviolacea]MBQ4837639.1 porin [Pseudoalteromonas luteoviolacea]